MLPTAGNFQITGLSKSHKRFLEDNRKYEKDGSPNLREQREWMENLPCAKMELDGTACPESNADVVVKSWKAIVE